MSTVKLTPTALFRPPARPVFLAPQNWLDECWTCAPRSPHAQELLEQEAKRKARAKTFSFDPNVPNLGALRHAMVMAQPAYGGSQAEYDAAHERWRDAMKRAHGHNGWINEEDIKIARLPLRRPGPIGEFE